MRFKSIPSATAPDNNSKDISLPSAFSGLLNVSISFVRTSGSISPDNIAYFLILSFVSVCRSNPLSVLKFFSWVITL